MSQPESSQLKATTSKMLPESQAELTPKKTLWTGLVDWAQGSQSPRLPTPEEIAERSAAKAEGIEQIIEGSAGITLDITPNSFLAPFANSSSSHTTPSSLPQARSTSVPKPDPSPDQELKSLSPILSSNLPSTMQHQSPTRLMGSMGLTSSILDSSSISLFSRPFESTRNSNLFDAVGTKEGLEEDSLMNQTEPEDLNSCCK
jgi:hypothetical protein